MTVAASVSARPGRSYWWLNTVVSGPIYAVAGGYIGTHSGSDGEAGDALLALLLVVFAAAVMLGGHAVLLAARRDLEAMPAGRRRRWVAGGVGLGLLSAVGVYALLLVAFLVQMDSCGGLDGTCGI